MATRKDKLFVLLYNEDTNEFSVNIDTRIELVDATTNRTFEQREKSPIDFAELDQATQALGLQLIASLQNVRNSKIPLNLP